MNRLIRVFEPSSDELDSQFTRRLDFFTGRHLGNQEFRLEQMYRDDRLRWLMEGRRAGIVHGLELDVPLEMEDATSLNPLGRFRIRPGIGFGERGLVLTLSLPLPVAWNELLTDWKDTTKQALPDGLYLVDVARKEQEVDPQTPSDPCRRDEPDALRDERIEWVAQAHLRGPLSGIGSIVGLDSWLVANRCAARLLGHSFTDRELYRVASVEHSQHLVATGVVVAVCAIVNGKPLWIDQTTVRRTLKPHADARALLNQTMECLKSVIANNPPTADVNDWATKLVTSGKLPLDWLPAAGELPVELLVYSRDAIEEEGKPWCPLFRAGIGLDLIPIRASAASGLIERELGRGPIQLSGNDRVRLLVAVADKDFRPDLLDVPPPDYALIDDVNGAYLTAYDRWRDYRIAYNRIFALVSPNLSLATVIHRTKTFKPEQEAQVTSTALTLSRDILTNVGISWRINPDQPTDIELLLANSPDSPDMIRQKLVDERMTALGAKNRKDDLPEPYDDDFPDVANGRYVNHAAWLTVTNNPWKIASVPLYLEDGIEADGQAVQIPILRQYVKWLDEQISIRSSKLDTVRDLLLALRHKLDSHSLNLASMSGGVATDGSGMRLTRWSPHVGFKARVEPTLPPRSELLLGPDPDAPAPLTTTQPPQIPRFNETRMFAAKAPSFIEQTTSTQKLQLFNNPNLKAVNFEGFIRKSSIFDVRQDILSLPKDASPLTPPGYTPKDESFGVLSHVSPEVYAIEELNRGLKVLSDALFKEANISVSFAPELASDSVLLDATTKLPDFQKVKTTGQRYEWLMGQGRALVQGIAVVENARRTREEALRSFVNERATQADRISALIANLGTLATDLNTARQAWDEAARDYAMAQSEMIRDWQAVELRDAERTRILMQPRGLFYVRTRSIPLSQTLADPLPLARKDADDVIPGCDSHHDLPSEMDDFLDAVWEVPVADFTALRPWLPSLPDRMRIATWLDRRDQRLQTKTHAPATNGGIVRTKLAPLTAQNRGMYRSQIGNRARFSDSLREFQREAAQVLSLTDVLAGQRGGLRSAGERLRDQCEQVIGCLVAQLESSLPSLRYEWAQAAEDDRLPVEDPEQWLGLDRLAERSFLTARTLVDTVRWLFAQLSNDGSGTGRTALRNLVRAAVIAVAHGDPSAHIRGPVVSAPAQLRPGSLLRVALNREALPGTRLHLFDQDHRVVGEVQVDDHDAQGAVVSLISSTSSTLSISTRFSVMQIKN